MRLIKVAVACVNQTPFAWDTNFAHLKMAIEQARGDGVTMICLPELAITGYGCEDAFFMDGLQDTAFSQLEALAALTHGMVVAVGLPLYHEKALYNAAAVLADGAIVGFAAKQFLAGDGIHYEPRWFKAWPAGEIDVLERTAPDGTIMRYPLGDLVFDIGDVRIGFEICEDAWVANRPGVDLALRGVDIMCNPSASHFAFRKYVIRQRFAIEASRAFGVTYLYANLMGNEAGRIIYDGGGLIASNNELVARGRRFSFNDVEMSSAVVDIDANRREQARRGSHRPRHDAEELVVDHPFRWPTRTPEAASKREVSWEDRASVTEEEFSRAVALGLWDYLRKSRAQGYVVSLSGGADSAACAILVALAVKLAFAELGPGGACQHLPWIKRLQDAIEGGGGAQEAVGALLACAYQPTENSGPVTHNAAEQVAKAIGAEFHVFDVDALYKGYISTVEASLGRKLSWTEDDVTLQNIQARVRAPSIWMLANLRGSVLLTTSNRSEAAVGYATMDGDTSGGLAPLGGIDKPFLRAWLRWLETKAPVGTEPIPELRYINAQQPTAELRPKVAGGNAQTDEADLMPYEFLEAVEDAAIRDKHTPLEVLQHLLPQHPQHSPLQLATWIERFFRLWCKNQWKRERLAPSFHLDDRNVDPRSWCRFPILSGNFERELAELRAFVASGNADR
ncbi:MAG: NAD+ synthetase [Deltaproteobacteria bacterium]|nr:NAD+ synthetase [Deltaproteobacteria bacterium]MDQ3301141.1 NAD+ synthetase [Myxococcota bacterium]